ncbi:Chromosome partitioning ATPase, Mrp family, contains Fe-S cluster [Selenomonas ruminantium]|uniref:Iron-sulfur cluster carrier protein n=1 Tax=Selenomonas ruminantium TaxID=971 RepID=A0A1M6RFV0_SELRU|nr:Mrp/NBP35 family ATP-binding protein [Selenomonas ruminantium]SHK31344.1 Chromosome partitioning ATPase, Mrp family, contains Fe-S cluster [Selenomonas ruminantium]
MSEACNHDCSSCGTTCGEDTRPKDLHEAPHELSDIRHVIAVVSGKGGVGKSLVTGLLSVAMSRKGMHVGIMDADITGPSIPKMFGVSGEVRGSEKGAYPVTSAGGIDIVSMNLLLDDDTDPVVWRGPIISGVVKQFWHDFIWEDVDYMFVDMPPGTGDVPLTVMQSIQLDGIIIVTSPQELVSMIVEKAVKMAEAMNVPILGLVENMSYFECPDCGKRHEIYGKSHIEEIAEEYDLDVLGRIPIQPQLAAECDAGQIETTDADYLSEAADKLLSLDK